MANSEPTESISYHAVERDEDVMWDGILNETLINANSRSQQTVGISSTFRNVGDEKIACSWSVSGRQKTIY